MLSKIRTFFNKGRSVNVSRLQNSHVTVIDQLIITSPMEIVPSLNTKKITKQEVLTSDAKKKFIGNASISSKHIPRSFYIPSDDSEISISLFNNKRANDLNLKNEVVQKNKILLLGSPGMGKTTELEKLAI